MHPIQYFIILHSELYSKSYFIKKYIPFETSQRSDFVSHKSVEQNSQSCNQMKSGTRGRLERSEAMSTPTISDFAMQFLTQSKGWSAKNQIACKVAKIYHREGLIEFAELIGKPVEEIEEGYALKQTMQKKNRSRRGQKSIKRKHCRDMSITEIAPPGLINWYQRKDFD